MPCPQFLMLMRSFFRSRPSFFLTLFLLAISISPANAVVLTWPSPPGWTAGAPAPGQTVSQNFTAVTPNDVNVAINNNGANLVGATWNAGYPAINSTLINGGMPGTNGIQLYLTSQSSTSSYVQLTITFANPVANLSFQIWDVDASSAYADTISQIQGLAFGGGTIAADSITSAIGGYNTITGSGLGTVVTGTATASNTTNQGSIDITFSQPITELSFHYSNSDSSLGSQGVALGPLTFVVVPETVPSWVIGLIGVIIIGADLLVRRKRIRF